MLVSLFTSLDAAKIINDFGANQGAPLGQWKLGISFPLGGREK
jgi:hypothetical protein